MVAMLPDNPLPIVFYDGACPLCRREIHHYRRLRGSERLRWVDVHDDGGLMQQHGLDRATALARFHVLDGEGQWQTGAWGFIEMWSHLPRWNRLAAVVRALRLAPLMDFAYRHFARWRLKRQCDTARCAIPEE